MPKTGDRIREIREARKLTQDQLAAKAGISKGFLSDVETGKRNISSANLLMIANVLNASIEYLLRGSLETQVLLREDVTIPAELSAAAEELGLTYAHTRELLDAQRSVVARRSSKQSRTLEKKDWIEFYKAIQKVFG
jgi:transcriptional regulator with XRE-family HTH domain